MHQAVAMLPFRN